MEEGANWITEAVRDKIYHSIDFPEIQISEESDITKALGKWTLEEDLEELLSSECVKKITMATKGTVSSTFCIAALKEGVVRIMNAIGLKEMKTRSIAYTMKNERKAPLELVMRGKSDGMIMTA